MVRRRATSFRPFEAYQPTKRWLMSKNMKRLLLVLFIFGTIWLYRYLSPPPVPVTRQGQLLKEFFDSQNVRKKIPQGETLADRRFLANLIPRPTPLPSSGRKILDTNVAEKLAELAKSRYVMLSNLQFCEILNGAVVDSFVGINGLNGAIATKNPTASELAALVDATAQKAYNEIFDIYGDVDPKVCASTLFLEQILID
jgi:hypothetical protein